MAPVSGGGATGPVCWAPAAWSGSSVHSGTKSERQRPLEMTAVGHFTSILPVDGNPGPRCDRKRRAPPVTAITRAVPGQVIVDEVEPKAGLVAPIVPAMLAFHGCRAAATRPDPHEAIVPQFAAARRVPEDPLEGWAHV